MESRTFRTSLLLRVVMLVAAGVWGAVLALLLRWLPEVSPRTLLTAAMFLAFFVGSSAYYARSAVTVGPEGLVFRGCFRRVPVRWDEIIRVDVRPGLAGTLYAVLTRRGLVQFTSLIARHRELLRIVLERADLAPRPA